MTTDELVLMGILAITVILFFAMALLLDHMSNPPKDDRVLALGSFVLCLFS